MKEEEIKEIENTLKISKPYNELGSYDYFNCESIEKLLEENKSLQSQLKAKEEAVEKFEKYLNNCVNELENNYGTSSIQNAINTGIVDITKVILSKYNEILSKGENKEIEFDVLKALNEDLDDDVEMSNM